ncbi:MAG: IS3 family transposase [Thermodesulfobacteriota bacterium]|nr:IS3 family transposase [Thermodesulfobacteriota bacterium]
MERSSIDRARPLLALPCPEVRERPERRVFSAEYKRRILKEIDEASQPGQIGAILRREGLYSSNIQRWREQRKRAELEALSSKRRGRKPTRVEILAARAKDLERENRRLQNRLKRAELLLDIQKKNFRDNGHPPEGCRDRRRRLMNAVIAIEKDTGTREACKALGIPKSSLYRAMKPEQPGHPPSPRVKMKHPRALSFAEREDVLAVLDSERFQDKSPSEVYATLLDEGVYLCSITSMYQILRQNNQVKERRRQARHPHYVKPVVRAMGPNQVWSWDITKLLGPVKWIYYCLYVILDIFSRYVVGWMIAPRESAELAARLIKETCQKQGIDPGQLIIHADRGSSMTSKPVASLLMDLGVIKSHSRPHVSNDNPFSESQFKTMKYMATFQKRFGSIEDARAFSVDFFSWYNWEHHHSGIGLMVPGDVHFGRAQEITARRQEVLDRAHLAHPERFVRRKPVAPQLPESVWINPPLKVILSEGGA